MLELHLKLDKNSSVEPAGRIYTNALFEIGDFIYLDTSKNPPKYRKAIEGSCDFLVVGRGTNYIDVAKSGFISLGQYSTPNHLYQLVGDLFIDSKGRITKTKTNTQVGYIDKGTLYVNIVETSNQIVSSNSYVHTQSSASNIWTINHNLRRATAVAVFDAGRNLILCDVAHNESFTVTTITLSSATSGTAVLS